MSYRLVEITAPNEQRDALCKLVERDGVNVEQMSEAQAGHFTLTVLVSPSARQALFDDVESHLEELEGEWRMLVLPVQAIIPTPEDEKIKKASGKKSSRRATPKPAKSSITKYRKAPGLILRVCS